MSWFLIDTEELNPLGQAWRRHAREIAPMRAGHAEERYDRGAGILLLERSTFRAVVHSWFGRAPEPKLRALGLIDANGEIDEYVESLVRVAAMPRRAYSIGVRDPDHHDHSWAWASAEMLVVATPVARNLLQFQAVHAADLPRAFAKLVNLGARPPRFGRRVVSVHSFDTLRPDESSWPELTRCSHPSSWNITALDPADEERLVIVVADLGSEGYWRVERTGAQRIELAAVDTPEVQSDLDGFAQDLVAA